MPDFDVKWPEADLRSVSNAIRRAQLTLGKTLKDAVEWAAILLAKSASASTEKAPKTRRIRTNDGADKRFPKSEYPYYREVFVSPKTTEVRRWHLKIRDDASYKDIRHSGTAKRSWLWMIPEIRGNGGGNSAQSVEKRNAGFDFEIEMANNLPYIRRALRVASDGEILLLGALGKASRKMEHEIDRKLKKAAS